MLLTHNEIEFKDKGTCLGDTNGSNLVAISVYHYFKFDINNDQRGHTKRCFTLYPYRLIISSLLIQGYNNGQKVFALMIST